MRFVFFFLSLFSLFFLACQKNEQDTKKQNSNDEQVNIEQSDVKIEVNDTNIPLPVDDDISQENKIQKIPFHKCFKCHDTIDKAKLDKLNTIQDLNHKLSKEELKNLSAFLAKGQEWTKATSYF